MPPLRVLVVEDEPTILEVFADALREAGCGVEATLTMADALDFLVRRQFDAIVADLRHPSVRHDRRAADECTRQPNRRLLGGPDRGAAPERLPIRRDGLAAKAGGDRPAGGSGAREDEDIEAARAG
jgi:CheY-like chemotaxis protein